MYVEKDTEGCILGVIVCDWVEEEADEFKHTEHSFMGNKNN